MSRKDVEGLTGKSIELRFVFIVSRHQRLFEKIVQSAAKLGDRIRDVIGRDGHNVFFWSGERGHTA